MQFRDQLAFIQQHLKKSKMRIAMTILATTIGCAFLITLASVAFGFQKTLEDEMFTDPAITQIRLWNDDNLDDEKLTIIRETEHVNAVVEKNKFYSTADMAIEHYEGYIEAAIYDMEAVERSKETLSEGRFPENEHEIVVGKQVAQSLLTDGDEGYQESLLNKTVQITFTTYSENEEVIDLQKEFTVVGVRADPPYEFMDDRETMFHQSVKALFDEEKYYTEFTIFVDTMQNVIPVVEELRAKDINVYSQLEQLEESQMIFLAIKICLIFVGTIAVVIASIGIFNTMTMAVTERTREIGILKALGATPVLIQRLFLMESLLIGLIGTIIAIIISFAISIAGNWIVPIIFEQMMNEGQPIDFELTFSLITPSLLFITTAISLFVALVSGWRPARHATKIEVVKALQQL